MVLRRVISFYKTEINVMAWRKEKRGERRRNAKFVNIVQFGLGFRQGFIPTRYVRLS